MLASDLLRDFRYALRTLRRSPGFVAVAVLSLGLGLGLTTTMFGLLDAVRHPYAPFQRPDALFTIYWRWDMRNVHIAQGDMYAQIRDNTSSVFDAVVPLNGFMDIIEEDQGEQRVNVARVPPNLFAVLGLQPERGRLFTDADESSDVVLVSHDLWKKLFRGRRDLTGLHLTLYGRSCAVIGVMPRGMRYPYQSVAWVPLTRAMVAAGRVGSPLVRLKAGVTVEAASAQLAVLGRRLDALYATEQSPFEFRLHPIREDPLKLRDIHWAMLGGAIFVLLIACANLANLMLARGLNARRDLALRLAIGATRADVVRQMFAECLVVAGAGGLLGALFSSWGASILGSSIPRDLEWVGILEPELSWRVFMFGGLAVVASAVTFGLIPAIRVVSDVNLDEPLKEGSANTTVRIRHRYSAMVMIEVALSLALLMGSGLLTKAARRLATQQYDFAARSLVQTMALLPLDSARIKNIEGTRVWFRQMRADALARTSALPNAVASATVSSTITNPGGSVSGERTTDTVRQFNKMGIPVVSPGYIRTMGFALVAGRDFMDGDDEGPGVAILNETAARILYPRGDAVGHMVKLGSASSRAPWVPIVGIVRTGPMRQQWTKEWTDDGRIFVARKDSIGTVPGRVSTYVTLLVRADRQDPDFGILVKRTLEQAGWRVFGGVTPYLALEMAEIRTRRFLAELFGVMASFALGLAAVGLYGVLAYAVTRRMREFGVRIAVGANRSDIVRIITHDSAVMALAGTALGGFLALGTSFLLEAYLLDVYPTDAWTLVISEAVLLGTAVLASLNPAIRAMRANPLEILRAI